MAEPLFKLNDVSYSYPGNIRALHNLSMTIDAGDRVAIIGVLFDAHKAGKTVVIATHDLHIVEEIADVIHVFGSNRAIIRSGKPEDILSDKQFLREHNLTHIHVHRHVHESHTHSH